MRKMMITLTKKKWNRNKISSTIFLKNKIVAEYFHTTLKENLLLSCSQSGKKNILIKNPKPSLCFSIISETPIAKPFVFVLYNLLITGRKLLKVRSSQSHRFIESSVKASKMLIILKHRVILKKYTNNIK